MDMLDTQQIELLATAYLEAQLIKNGFEVARPVRDRGIDLIVYSDKVDEPFHVVPIQLKAASEQTFYVNKKYQGRGIVMAYLWHALSERPRLFLVPHDEAVSLLPERTLQTSSWQDVGHWRANSPSKALIKGLLPYEDAFHILSRLVPA